jgi:hypothetical protein
VALEFIRGPKAEEVLKEILLFWKNQKSSTGFAAPVREPDATR